MPHATNPSRPPPVFNWRLELGEIPTPTLPGYARTTMHPIRMALNAGGEVEQRAIRVLRRALFLAEGQITMLAAILDVHPHTAFRYVHASELAEYAGELRYKHRHAGPNGIGVQPRKRKLSRRRAAA